MPRSTGLKSLVGNTEQTRKVDCEVLTMNDKTTSSGGLCVLDVVGIIFITLKIIEVEPVVRWPWWLVLSPLWIYIGVLAVVALIAWCIKNRKN